MAATFEKANTYVFAAPIIRDREVGGSNLLAPTIRINYLRLPTLAAVFHLWQICGHVENYFLGQSVCPNIPLSGFHISVSHDRLDRKGIVTS